MDLPEVGRLVLSTAAPDTGASRAEGVELSLRELVLAPGEGLLIEL
jgi:hypothetical protein